MEDSSDSTKDGLVLQVQHDLMLWVGTRHPGNNDGGFPSGQADFRVEAPVAGTSMEGRRPGMIGPPGLDLGRCTIMLSSVAQSENAWIETGHLSATIFDPH